MVTLLIVTAILLFNAKMPVTYTVCVKEKNINNNDSQLTKLPTKQHEKQDHFLLPNDTKYTSNDYNSKYMLLFTTFTKLS